MSRKRIGIVGFGHLGQYLTDAVLNNCDLELAFVWNRTQEIFEGRIDKSYICRDLENFSSFAPDLVVEVAHPIISQKYGAIFLEVCDYMVGSPTALANNEVERSLRQAAKDHGLYIPAGALWGGQDIAKMADNGTLQGIKVTMKKHPTCFKLNSPIRELNEKVTNTPTILFDGPVRELCPLAPNNVNTMAAAAIAAHNLGFNKVVGCLVSDPNLRDWHIVETEVIGPSVCGNSFTVKTTRMNPANQGAVTGSATYGSFFSSLLRAWGMGPGVHLC